MTKKGCQSGLDEQPGNQVISDHPTPQPGIDPIKNAAVAGQQVARVLDADLPFDHTLAQIP